MPALRIQWCRLIAIRSLFTGMMRKDRRCLGYLSGWRGSPVLSRSPEVNRFSVLCFAVECWRTNIADKCASQRTSDKIYYVNFAFWLNLMRSLAQLLYSMIHRLQLRRNEYVG
jgi:hypothetical protein